MRGLVVGGFPKCYQCGTCSCSRPGRCREPYTPPRWTEVPTPTGSASESYLSDEIQRLKAALREIHGKVAFLSDSTSWEVAGIAAKALGEE